MKKFIIIVITLLVLSNTYLLYNNYNLKKQVLSYEEKSNIRRKNAISMMLETEANSKTYVQSTDNKWPTDGYIFNEEMSKCEQGSKLKWDDNNQKVIMEGNVSDKCYVFFDKYNPIKINSYTITPNGNKVTISISATSGTGTIAKYYYSKDDGASYVDSTSNTYTFTNLANGTYKIKAYVLDSNNKISEFITKNIEITSMRLSEYIMSQYTGTQGENGIYYHDSNLTNGAGDNSYRFAGASDAVNNYVCFGSTQSPCPADNLYRIIGVFGDKVKLIKSDYANSNLLGTDGDYSTDTYSKSDYSKYKGELTIINRYYWNYKNDTSINRGNGLNEWSISLLNKINLNTNYLNNIGSKWANMIAVSTWKFGGNTGANIYSQPAKTAYQNEIVSPVTTNTTDNATEYSAKIGLMYATDWGFAINQNRWNRTLSNYGFSGIENENWLYLGIHEFLATRNIDNSYFVFCILDSGSVFNFNASVATAIRPTFYLNSSIIYSSGDGTKTNPIRITD